VLLHCFITPDHSLTGLFRIESNWKIVQIEVGDHRFHFQRYNNTIRFFRLDSLTY
jgi:urease beta subunit